MPEIKHQFTGGKMNKDLDERLVPNGEYRDALNIQVSTSEESDVGTVQNILGNSLVPGQDFINENAVCVGSIADEKNDKLYYFITNNEELIANGGFDNDLSGWWLSSGWTHANGQIEGVSVEASDKINQSNLPIDKFILDREYEVSFTVSGYVAGNINVKLRNENGKGFNIPNFIPENKTYTFTGKIGTHNTTNTTFYSRFYIQAGDVDFTGNIDNISIKPKDSAIIEYDSKTNFITPVLVDMIGDVLKFNPNNIITGINVIDDLLLWTDNKNEPKKINIQRSIEGTDPSGLVHTYFINDKRTDIPADLSIKEEHITVIKKAPKLAPTIGLISERFDNPNSTYTGVMRITSVPTIPLVPYDDNLANTSSLWTSVDSQFNHRYDFSWLNVDSYFDVQIETDVNGDSGFTLDWEPYDIILFKEFTGPNYDELPKIPIVDYSIKAKIVNYWGVDQGGPNTYTDTDSEIIQNGDFTIPNSTGYMPKYWSLGTGITYLPASNSIQYDTTDFKKAITDSPTQPIQAGVSYDVSYEVSNYNSGTIRVYMIFEDPNQSGYWFTRATPYLGQDGIHTFTITTTGATSGNSNTWGNRVGKIIFQSGPNGFDGVIENISITKVSAANAKVRCRVLALNNPPTVPEFENELRFAVDKQNEAEKLFEFKFPRFAYRYQYEDREYSTMSPFSQIAFLPGNFDYHPKKGYNLGMTNRVNEIGIKDFATDVPDGVIAIDLLYKDDASPNIYVVDTIKPTGSNIWNSNEFVVTSEQISKVLPSNQLLRLWDNVPRKALAQDISGNRIIYGNYTQGFDLKSKNQFMGDEEDYYPLFDFNWIHNSNYDLSPKKSIKSLREYQLGIVFVDEYGRETPVMTNESGNKKLNKIEADKQNTMEIDFQNQKFPENMKYFKFFIKETSGEYYNLAMDRYYDAEDNHVWLSFPSSDRNKLDIDTFLILKKAVESDQMVKEEARYKVIDIQNEAPNFIKQKKTLIERKKHVIGSEDIFGSGLNDAPLIANDFFKMNYYPFRGSSGSELHDIKDSSLYIEFTDATNYVSKRYRISEITSDYVVGQTTPTLADANYSVKLDKPFGDDINFIALGGAQAPTAIKEGTIVNIYKYTVENSPKFDGRFFVKINIDATFDENLNIESSIETSYRTVLSKKLYYLSDNNNLHSTAKTGQTKGKYGDASNFGRFAPFFRNYNKVPSEFNETGYGNLGQYMFGPSGDNNKRWLRELAWVTTSGLDDGILRNDQYGNTDKWPGVKVADEHGWNSTERGGVFNDNEEQTAGDVWFIDGANFVGGGGGDNLWWPGMILQGGTGVGILEGTSGIGALMEIAIGGVYNSHVQAGMGTSGGDPEYFNVGGGSSGNSNYDGGTENLVSKIYPGQKFRFREDPSGEIYTFQPSIQTYQRLRWKRLALSAAPSGEANHGEYSFDWYSPNAGEGWQSIPPAVDDWHEYDNTDDTKFEVYATQLSPNFSKNYRPRFTNESGTGIVNWNPTGSPGTITNGLKLAIQHSDASNTWDGTDQPWIGVDSLLATDANGLGTHAITTGMILTSHSDDGSPVEYGDGTAGEEFLAIKRIVKDSATETYRLYLSGYSKFLTRTTSGPWTRHNIFDTQPTHSEEVIFMQPKMNGYSQYSVNRINAQHGGSASEPIDGGIMAIGYNLEFVEAVESEPALSTNPAIWETEPKESTPLDIYYEASGLNPLKLDSDTASMFIPIGSTVESYNSGYIETGTTVTDFANVASSDAPKWQITLSTGQLVQGEYIEIDDHIRITRPNGDIIVVKISDFGTIDANNRTSIFEIYDSLYGGQTRYTLNWYNCYSFGNGVESNRIRDNFNLPFISNGVKASTTLEEGLGEEHRKYGLIYSGIYNSNSSTNNLNQFIAAEKITKDVNPIYGSIQKLHSRDSDLVTLCEDKCLRILANKDAVFNADGNPNLIATDRVLGQTYTFSGEFGISKNPESFASESYRVYFTDKVRGAVMRLSKDGLTPISMYGMKDWFKDNLRLSDKLIGSYDDRKDEYNITLDNSVDGTPKTVSFKEDVKGWVSFKSFFPETGTSVTNNYYTVLNGRLYRHHNEEMNRNHFYGVDYNSSVNVILNDAPGSVKSFHTLDYEGSQSKVEGIKTVEVTGIEHASGSANDGKYFFYEKQDMSDVINNQDYDSWDDVVMELKQYRSNVLIYSDKVRLFNMGVNSTTASPSGGPTKGHGRYAPYSSSNPGDFEIGDIITTQLQEDSVSHFNSMPKDGWFVSDIETDKQEGNIHEFIEKEGKWFNYIKGIDSDITSETDFGAFDIQGIGILSSISSGVLTFSSSINTSLQVGDIIYFQTPTNGPFDTIDSSNITKYGDVTAITDDTITVNLIDSTPVADDYIMFAKNHTVNTSSLLGYFADVKFENNSIEKIELFSVGSEITESSK